MGHSSKRVADKGAPLRTDSIVSALLKDSMITFWLSCQNMCTENRSINEPHRYMHGESEVKITAKPANNGNKMTMIRSENRTDPIAAYALYKRGGRLSDLRPGIHVNISKYKQYVC